MSATGLATNAVTQLRQQRRELPAPQPTDNAATIDSAISALSAYIPAEAMAIYLAVSSSLDAIVEAYPAFSPHWVYWAFVFGFSPGLFLLAYFTKLANAKSPLPAVREFPWFRLVSSVIAFAVWGLCVPDNPFAGTDPGAGVLFGILATIVSVILPSTEAIWQWFWEQKGATADDPDSGVGEPPDPTPTAH